MADATLLAVADADHATAIASLAVNARVEYVSDLDALHRTLALATVDAAFVGSPVDGVAAPQIARSMRTLFPDLPLVVRSDDDVPVESASVVDAQAVDDEAIETAIEEALADPQHSDAARPPSRMETLLVSLFEYFPAHVYAKDGDARHVMTSETLEESNALLGRTDRELDMLPDAVSEATYEDDRQVIETGQPTIDVEEYVEAEGRASEDVATREASMTDALTSKVPWYDADGSVIGLAGITQDITEQKHRDRAARRQHERLSKVALVAAHELRNEIQIAYGRLQHVDADSEHLASAEDSLARLSGVVDDLVTMASHDQLDVGERVVWLSSLARDCWEGFDAEDVDWEVVDDRRLEVPPESVKLLLQICFENAVDHARPDGGGGADAQPLTVTVGATEEGFYVADDGKGIDVDPPDRVFDAAYSTDPDAPGFGLYVARRIADELGWTLEVAPSETGGARFEVTGVERIE